MKTTKLIEDFLQVKDFIDTVMMSTINCLCPNCT